MCDRDERQDVPTQVLQRSSGTLASSDPRQRARHPQSVGTEAHAERSVDLDDKQWQRLPTGAALVTRDCREDLKEGIASASEKAGTSLRLVAATIGCEMVGGRPCVDTAGATYEMETSHRSLLQSHTIRTFRGIGVALVMSAAWWQ